MVEAGGLEPPSGVGNIKRFKRKEHLVLNNLVKGKPETLHKIPLQV